MPYLCILEAELPDIQGHSGYILLWWNGTKAMFALA